MILNETTFYTDSFIPYEWNKRISKPALYLVNMIMGSIVYFIGLIFLILAIYYGINIFAQLWNETALAFVPSLEASKPTILKYVGALLALKWTFFNSPNFANAIRNSPTEQGQLDNTLNNGLRLLFVFLMSQLFNL